MPRFTKEQLAEYEAKARAWNGHSEKKKADAAAPPKPSKYRNTPTNGYDSKRESDRAAALNLMQKAGQIRNLREQVPYELIPKQAGERACSFRADFVYEELRNNNWELVVEDTKGVRTQVYILKRKLMLHVHGIKVREV